MLLYGINIYSNNQIEFQNILKPTVDTITITFLRSLSVKVAYHMVGCLLAVSCFCFITATSS
jgi:hypothetical protein